MLNQIKSVMIREWHVILKSPRMVFQAFLQPAIYFLIFVPIMAQSIRQIQVTDKLAIPYTIYVLPGIIIFNAFTAGQYAGISTYIDKLSGELETLFGLPIKRSVLVVGKVFSATLRTFFQSIVIILLAKLLVGDMHFSLVAYFSIVVVGVVFSWISVLIYSGLSAIIKSQDTFNILVNLVTMPLVFTSTVFYPMKSFPGFLEIIARINPLTFFINLMRRILFNMEVNYLTTGLLMLFLVAVSFLISNVCYNRSLQ